MQYAGFTNAKNLLLVEIRQKEEEGFLIPESLKNDAANLRMDSPDSAYQTIYSQLKQVPRRPDFPFEEPNELEAIRKLRPQTRMKKTELPYDMNELRNRYYGAWLGRCTGCALGKPVEGLALEQKHQGIRIYLEQRGDWPLRDYFSGREIAGSSSISCPRSTREQIAFMETDDDIRYTLLGLKIFEKYGMHFTPVQIARLWFVTLPLAQVATAEQQALLNFGMYFQALPNELFDAEFTSTFNNPYREWIGAQIRADFFGFMAPGDPETAAGYAWRDASWTHRKNGIYGAMFIAAVEAAAFVSDKPAELIAAGLGEIPENCRLAYEIREALKVIPRYRDMDGFSAYLDKRFAGMSDVHTVNNAVLCTAALFYGKMNPDRSVCEAVTGGLDTDCNGATVGAITGIVAGGKNFGGILAPRLNNLIRSEMTCFGDLKITELAERTLQVYQKVR